MLPRIDELSRAMDLDTERNGAKMDIDPKQDPSSVPLMSQGSKKRASKDITHIEEGEPAEKKAKLADDMTETNVRQACPFCPLAGCFPNKCSIF